MYIYCITNLINNKKYIGLTAKSSPYERWNEHIRAAKRNESNIIYKAIRKYKVDNFYFEVIDVCLSADELVECEIEWISKLDTFTNGYNMTLGGEGIITGKGLSEEHKRKISKSNLGKKCTPEHIEKNKQSKLKNPTNYWLGKKMPQSMIEKFKKVHNKPVSQFSKDGILIKHFDSIKSAEEELNMNGAISKVCSGKRKTAGGYIWRYKK